MQQLSANLRKAAVLVRSLDEQTAATLLAQLPASDAAAVRAAVERLESIDPEEQADVAAEMRRAAPLTGTRAGSGVELALSSAAGEAASPNVSENYTAPAATAHFASGAPATGGSRFEFLDQAPITSLVPYLAREHAQTIAVVLSYLSPSRAAAVLSALPPRQQADALERISALGDTDPISLNVVEQELAAWVAAQASQRRGARSGGAARAILAAANATTREAILANLKTHKRHLATQLEDRPKQQTRPANTNSPTADRWRSEPRLSTQLDTLRQTLAAAAAAPSNPPPPPQPQRRVPSPPPAAAKPQIKFDDLVRLDAKMLATVLHDVDANVLVLALVGSNDELVDRIVGQMPKRTAKAFRQQLRKLGPTRLSDVEAAQQVVARAAEQRIRRRAAMAGTASR